MYSAAPGLIHPDTGSFFFLLTLTWLLLLSFFIAATHYAGGGGRQQQQHTHRASNNNTFEHSTTEESRYRTVNGGYDWRFTTVDSRCGFYDADTLTVTLTPATPTKTTKKKAPLLKSDRHGGTSRKGLTPQHAAPAAQGSPTDETKRTHPILVARRKPTVFETFDINIDKTPNSKVAALAPLSANDLDARASSAKPARTKGAGKGVLEEV